MQKLLIGGLQTRRFIGLYREKLPFVAPDTATLAALIKLDKRARIDARTDRLPLP